MPPILVLADDLTGALEAGAGFAQNGLRTILTFGEPVSAATQVHVIDAGTRHLSEHDAAVRTTQLTLQHPAKLIYKKTDSTLRGNIRAELVALTAFGPVLYVPAYPQLGRTVVNGCLHVDGVALGETAFAQDALHPVRSGNLRELLGSAPGITISSASTPHEIEQAAQRWLQLGGIAAGPAALAHAAAALLRTEVFQPPVFPAIKRALVVVGSRHPSSRHQVRFAAHMMKEAEWTVMQSPTDREDSPFLFAARFGQQVADHFRQNRYDTLIVFGGDTAKAILQAMNMQTVEPWGEPVPGVPLSKLPDGTTLITKAGGFGAPDVLRHLHKQLSHVDS